MFYEGQWKQGLKDGEGFIEIYDKMTYTGSFVKGKKTGKGKLVWQSGNTYEGDLWIIKQLRESTSRKWIDAVE